MILHCQDRSYVEARGVNYCLLVICPVILHATRSHTTTKDVVIRRIFDGPNAFGGRAQPGMLRPRGHIGLEAKSFGLGLSLGLTLSGLGLDLGLMASGLVASNIYSAHDIN